MDPNERSLPHPGDVPKWVYHEVLDALEDEQRREEEESAEMEEGEEGVEGEESEE